MSTFSDIHRDEDLRGVGRGGQGRAARHFSWCETFPPIGSPGGFCRMGKVAELGKDKSRALRGKEKHLEVPCSARQVHHGSNASDR